MEVNLQKINRINSTFTFNRIIISEFHYFAFYYFIYSGPGIKGNMPLYMKIYLIVSLLLRLILYLQEREYIFKNYNRKIISSELQYI